MSNRPRDTNVAPQFTAFPGFDPSAMLQAFTPQMNGGLPFCGNAFAGWMEINRHWTAFLMNRFQQYPALVHRLGACSPLMEISSAYSEFFQKALEDYQSEFAKIAKLGQKNLGAVTPTAKT